MKILANKNCKLCGQTYDGLEVKRHGRHNHCLKCYAQQVKEKRAKERQIEDVVQADVVQNEEPTKPASKTCQQIQHKLKTYAPLELKEKLHLNTCDSCSIVFVRSRELNQIINMWHNGQ